MVGNIHHVGLTVRMPTVFDETAIGLDHLAFAVPTRAELSDWERRFAAAGHVPLAGPGGHGQPQVPGEQLRSPS